MLRIATVGTSGITTDFINEVNASDRARFVGTLSRNEERARAYTEEHGGTQPFTELTALATSDDVDAVYIGSPNALHARQALACIAAGKHVICEKSLASNEREARELFAAAERAGVVLLEAMRPLHDPSFVAVGKALPKLGRIHRASFHYGSYSSRYDEIRAGRRTNIFDCAMASGGLMDLGVYTVEPLIELFGAPERISAAGSLLDESTRELTNGALDGAGTILAHYPDKIVVLNYSKVSNDRHPSQVEGEDATLVFDNISNPQTARIEFHGKVERSTATTSRDASDARIEELGLHQVPNTMVYELNDFIDAVSATEAGTPALEAPAGPFGSVAHYRDVTLASLALMDEARRQMGVAFPADAVTA